MFRNAGKKMGIIIRIITIFNMILVLVAGIVGIVSSINNYLENWVFPIILIVLVLEFFNWLGSLFIIGFCDMMHDVHEIRNCITSGQYNNGIGNYQKLSELRAQGLISQEDFNRRVGGNNL